MEKLITCKLAGENDIEFINAFYNRIYKKNRTSKQFVWEFQSAPAGKAIYVIAIHENKIVGTQCAIPYFLINGNNQSILSAKSEDTLVDPDYRGQNIFEKMYDLLIDECKKKDIQCIWGFTYAQKPFKKLNFDIPYHSQMGILVLKPLESYFYYSNLSSNNSFLRKLKILALCLKSKVDYLSIGLRSNKELSFIQQQISLNSDNINYLKNTPYFGLLLNKEFLNYRIYNNPYSSNYHQCSVYNENELEASVFYTVNNGIGYILHMYFSEISNKKNNRDFIYSVIKKSNLKDCKTIRFWGFNHNKTNESEIELLRQLNFTFINNGISFVGLQLNKQQINWNDFILSRLASQGTD